MWKFLPFAFLLLLVTTCAPPSLLPEPGPVSNLESTRAKALCVNATRLLVEHGKVHAAASELDKALALDPEDPTCRQWAAWVAGLLRDDVKAFEHLLWVIRSGSPLSELAIWDAYRLFATRGQAQELAQTLQSVVQQPGSSPLVCARARNFLGHTLRYLGRFEEAKQAFGKLGYLSDWMMVGPFNNDQNAGFESVYPPEQGFSSYAESYPGKLRAVGWRKVTHFDYDGRVNLAALLDPSRWACAYLVTFLKVSSGQEVALRLGAYRGVKLWLNGRKLLADDQAHLGAMDQYLVGGRLEPGWNKLLVKVCQHTGSWQLRLRITDLSGRILKIPATVDIHSTPDRSRDTSALPEPEHFGRSLEGQPEDALGLKKLASAVWSLRCGFFQRAVEQGIALAEAHPGCPLYQMFLSRAHLGASHQGSALKALSNAERISSDLPNALLERASYEQQHKRYNRAMEILAPLTKAKQVLPAAQVVYLSLLSDRGWTFDALQAAKSFVSEQPDRPWTWRLLGSLHHRLGQPESGSQAYQEALRLQADDQGTYDRLIDAALERGQEERALELIRRKGMVFPSLITSALGEAEILLARGDHRAAEAVCDRIQTITPEYWYQYKLRGDIHYRQGDRYRALQSYQTALKLQPNNPTLREYLDFLEQRRDIIFERYGLGQALVEQILTNPPDLSADPEAEVVFLLDDHVTHVFQDGTANHLVHQIYFIRTEKGQHQFSRFGVPSGPSFRLEAAETIKPDGTRQEATSIRPGEIHFPSLEPGSILHIAYRYESSSTSWMEDHFAMSFDFQGPYPCRRARWVLALPSDKELKVLKRGKFIQEQTEIWDGEKVTIWAAENAPMLHQEEMRPPIRLLQAAVYVSTVPSWEALARWQNSLISDQFEIDAEVRKKAQALTRNAQTPMEKLRAIYQFVAKEIRYLHHDVGIFGKKPNQAVNIFENRFGDCKDKATLMIAMLKEVGIQAAYAGVRTFEEGPVFWEVPHAQTNHIITYIPPQPGIEKELFIDGTSQFGDMLYLPDQDQGVLALVLDGKTYQTLTTPTLPPETSTLDCRMTSSISQEGTLNISATERWTGWFSYIHRSKLNVEGKRSEELTKEISYRYPGAVLDEASFHNLDHQTPEASARYSTQVPGRVRREGRTLRINLLWPSNLTQSIARKPDRYYDIFLAIRTNYFVSSTLSLPTGASVQTLPSPFSIDNDFIKFEQSCTQASFGKVSCSRTLTFKTRTIPRDRYQEFRNACNQIDRSEAQDIVLVPKS